MTKQSKLVVVILALLLGAAGWQIFQTTDLRSTPKLMADKPLPPDGFILPTLSAAAQKGETAFDANCAICHGSYGLGTTNGPPFMHRIYEPNHHGDIAFVLAARNGVQAHHWKYGNMPAVDGLSDQELSAIIAYVRELQKANGIF